MTKDKFIDGYIVRSKGLKRTPDGVSLLDGSYRRVALPCACGEEGCDGWAMVKNDPEAIADHKLFCGPRR